MSKSVYLIAGEDSGDFLGSELISDLKKSNKNIQFHGIGSDLMLDAGLKNSLFEMSDLSLMGIAEVLPKIPMLLNRINSAVEDIIEKKPDVIVTIDAPDFCFRVIKKLRKKGVSIPVVHYVAPTVWAWRPGRAKKVAQFLDHMLCLFPFEPSYFQKEGLKASFVGHPLVKKVPNYTHNILDEFKVENDLDKDQLITLLPGSRRGEIDRLLPVFIDTVKDLKCDVVLVAVKKHRQYIKDMIVGQNITIIDQDDKYKAIQASDCVLNASGTVTLELALSNAPSINCYKISPITHFILKRMVVTEYASLTNTILDQPVVPEYLQDDCKADNLRRELDQFLNGDKGKQQQSALNRVKSKLTPNKTRAKDVVLSYLN